jgi:hypothetical protein
MSQHKDALGAFVAKICGRFLVGLVWVDSHGCGFGLGFG